MRTLLSLPLTRPIAIILSAAVFTGCAEHPLVAPTRGAELSAQRATLPGVDTDGAIATLQRVTARYHNLDVAKSEGFVLLHECESRPGEGPVGIVYVNPGRLMDGKIDPASPDALIYEPSRIGRPKLVGAEFAIPYALAPGQQPPTFLGATFQNEEEFGVFALHAWIWRNNPDGLFAETNPRVSCDAE
jgi:hypothetical protein